MSSDFRNTLFPNQLQASVCDTILTINPWIKLVGLFLFLAGETRAFRKLNQNTQKCEEVIKSWFLNISGSRFVVSGPAAFITIWERIRNTDSQMPPQAS